MDFHQLRYFLAVAECGNVSRAAARCHVAQPSLSQQLKKIETHLGVKLFDRLGRGVALTDAGRALLPRARRILAEVRDTEANLEREAKDRPGMLAIGAIPTMAPYLLPPALESLRQAHPDCQVMVREDLTDNLVEALADNEIDCALVSTPLEHELVEMQILAEEELVVVVPRDHPKSANTELSLADLRGQPTVSLEEIHCLGQQIQGFCSSRHIGPRVVCRMTQLSTIVELVSLGMGISIIPEMAAAAETSRRCRFLRLRPGKPTRQIAVAWRTGRSRPVAAMKFVEAVQKNFNSGAHSLGEGPIVPGKRATTRTQKKPAGDKTTYGRV